MRRSLLSRDTPLTQPRSPKCRIIDGGDLYGLTRTFVAVERTLMGLSLFFIHI